jgi:hypothetical protein
MKLSASIGAPGPISKRRPRLEFDVACLAILEESIWFLLACCGRPKKRQFRDELSEQAKAGRRFLALLDHTKYNYLLMGDAFHLAHSAVENFCLQAEQQADCLDVRGGRAKRVDLDRQNFILSLIIIAHRIGLRSTGAINTASADKERLSPFFQFVKEAIKISKDVIKSSAGVPAETKRAAITLLDFPSDRSLGLALRDCMKVRKIIEESPAGPLLASYGYDFKGPQ